MLTDRDTQTSCRLSVQWQHRYILDRRGEVEGCHTVSSVLSHLLRTIDYTTSILTIHSIRHPLIHKFNKSATHLPCDSVVLIVKFKT